MKKAIFSATALIIFSASAMAKNIDEKKASNEVKKEELVKVESKKILLQKIDCVDRYYATLYDYAWMAGNTEQFIANTVYDSCMCCSGN